MRGLLIIDIQNDYFPGGAAELVAPEKALANSKMILSQFREKKFPVIHVQHINTREGATFFLPGSHGVKIHEQLAPQDGEHVVVKNYPNSFYKTNLLELIKTNGISELTVCGMMTHMCVDTTVRAAQDYGLPITLIADACASKNLVFQNVHVAAHMVQAAYMAALSGMFANVVDASGFSLA